MVATAGRLAVPRRADLRFLAHLGDAGRPKVRATVRLTALPQSSRYVPAAIIAEGARRPSRVALGMTTYLVEHPQARFLVDPAMCEGVHERVLPGIPQPIRYFVKPERPITNLPEALREVGLGPSDVDFCLPTHLHWDHVSGLLELPMAVPVRTLAAERDFALAADGPPHGVVLAPLHDRHFETYELDGPPVLTFQRSHDLFGDGSVVLVDLAGHTPGSVGVLLALDDGRDILLAGDAIWHGLQTTLIREKAPFPGNFVDRDRNAAFYAIHRLHALPSTITVVASHDREAAAAFLPQPVV
ncbi:MBL fold metallo-hydrolase [Fodinicola feengrottensis]|uniref:MBL fold metallo-hydrolase n=2 Tax=Fodinicola feengrottensis TaxID=435914 RepID=A0ABP4TPL8_9ACTN